MCSGARVAAGTARSGGNCVDGPRAKVPGVMCLAFEHSHPFYGSLEWVGRLCSNLISSQNSYAATSPHSSGILRTHSFLAKLSYLSCGYCHLHKSSRTTKTCSLVCTTDTSTWTPPATLFIHTLIDTPQPALGYTTPLAQLNAAEEELLRLAEQRMCRCGHDIHKHTRYMMLPV